MFVSEYICGGAWPGSAPAGSLDTEGRAMLGALVEDFSRIAGVCVTTTWDARLGPPPFGGVHTEIVASPADEAAVFFELARVCDGTLVVAPETDGVLEERSRLVEHAGGRLLGPSSAGVALCASKLKLAQALADARVAVIPTRRLPRTPGNLDYPTSVGLPGHYPIVVKPDDGAGSQETYRVDKQADLALLLKSRAEAWRGRDMIWQPWIDGHDLSMAMLLDDAGDVIESFPPCEQILSDDGRLRYRGGVVPARGVARDALNDAAQKACSAVRGLRGYVGIDFVVPREAPRSPLVAEINPRITTSYCGYRRLTRENIALHILTPDQNTPGVSWGDATIAFDSAGALRALQEVDSRGFAASGSRTQQPVRDDS